MAKRYNLSAEPRTIIGKQVKQLRRKQILPANVYGHKVEATAISLALLDFKSVFKQAGETGLIDLQVHGEPQTRPVLINDTLVDPVTGALLHIDFYQVNLKEKLTATVPLEFEGESPIVKAKEGILLELLQEVEVESLPTNIPSSIVVDISNLTEVDQGIKVGDLPLPAGVEMQTDAEELVCKIETAQMAEEVVEEVVVPEGEEAAAGEEEAPAETSETDSGNS
jgi:large subunit ribosomal protein L25